MMEQTWDVLEDVLKEIVYTRDPIPDQIEMGGKKWPAPPRFHLTRYDESNYARLDIHTYNVNTYRPDEMRCTRHEFVVPVATYHRAAWIRWVFDRIASIELHETTECFQVNGERIYAPHHGNGWDPYTIWYDDHPGEKAKAPGDD